MDIRYGEVGIRTEIVGDSLAWKHLTSDVRTSHQNLIAILYALFQGNIFQFSNYLNVWHL